MFGPAEDSVYFFTVPILSGIFVSSLLITIILIGLTMIFDVKTMDQFDDPKGKSITINASD
jgi:V-type H+-transporting ATPase S1 subunit